MKVGSLFSGIGGFDLGLERAGMEIAWQVEIDPFCNEVLAAHWPEVRRLNDIRGLSFHNLRCGIGVKALQVCTCNDANVSQTVAVGAEQYPIVDGIQSVSALRRDVVGVNVGVVPAAIHTDIAEPPTQRQPPRVLVRIGPPLVDDVGLPTVPATEPRIVCPLCGGMASDESVFDFNPASAGACFHGKNYIAFAITKPDLICAGVPCQPFSVAGRRQGENDERNLWPEFFRIVRELRPQWIVAENVPGILSVHGGRFFGEILDRLGELGFQGVSYAVLDSQHFGVAQRRRRVFIVAGPSRRSVEQVLSLCESCGGHPQAGRETGEDVASPLGASATSFGGQRYDLDNETYVAFQDDSKLTNSDKTAYLGVGGSGQAYIAHSLSADGFDASEDGTGRGTPLVAIRTANTGANGHGLADDVAHTIDGANGQAVAFQQNSRDEVRLMGGDGRYAGALSAEPGMKQQNYVAGASVRRLTPTECERLQGFPDGWTDIAGAKDGPRYRALGNAVTVLVIEYLGRRMREAS